MKIIVCIKQVPAASRVEVDEETGTLIRMGSDTKTNPYDLFAIETADCYKTLINLENPAQIC